jgi:hypothetical protein
LKGFHRFFFFHFSRLNPKEWLKSAVLIFT